MNKPKKRTKLRITLGKIYFFIKKHIYWLKNKKKLAKKLKKNKLKFLIFTHKSLLLKPLKDVEMYLQYNKCDNLKIAINHLNGLIIEPEAIFSYWYLIGNPTKKKGYKKGLILKNGGFYFWYWRRIVSIIQFNILDDFIYSFNYN